MALEEALTSAVKECIAKGILAEFLIKHGAEVINMLATEWKIEDALEVAKEEGLEEGIEIGKAEGKAEVKMEVLSLLEQGYSIDEIKAKLKPQ
jgi:predicted transposase YdaD